MWNLKEKKKNEQTKQNKNILIEIETKGLVARGEVDSGDR